MTTKRVLAKGMIGYDSGDYVSVYSDKGKRPSCVEVIVNDTLFYMPLLGLIKKSDYPELEIGHNENKPIDGELMVKIEKQLL